MRNTKWIPILLIVGMIGTGLWAGLNLAVSKQKKEKRPPVLKETSVESSTGKAITAEVEEKPNFMGVLREVDEKNKKIVLYNLSSLKEEGYVYDLATHVKNSFDREVVMRGLERGAIVEVFIRNGGGLSAVKESKEAWTYRNVTNLESKEESLAMKIGDRLFLYDAGLTIINGREQGDFFDLLPEKDVLDVRGIGEKILSIVVVKGHGSLDFANFDEFLGGTIEVGYEVFDEVRENMKYVLREGTYKVILANGGLLVNKVVDIERDRIRLLDIEKLTNEADKKSAVQFSISPRTAMVMIDGKEIEARKSIRLPYGEYILRVEKEGYLPWEDVVRFNKPTEKVEIRLAASEEKKSEEEEKGKEEEEGMEEPSEERISEEGEEIPKEKPEIRVRVDEERKISILKPEGAEILFDDEVIGVAPCDTVKVTGEHKITIRKEGYSSVSYTVDIEDDGEDAVFSFPELVK